MILTCPECATSYFVDDDRIPAAGRTVKCSSCGNRWRALPEGESEAEFEPAPPPSPSSSPVDAEALEPEDEEPAAVADDDIEFVPAPIKTGRKPPSKARDRDKGGSRGVVVGVVVLGLLAAAGGAAAIFREQVAGMVPGSAAVFAAIGLPVNDLGLSFEGVNWKPTFLAGRPVMAVTGAIRNTGKEAVVAPGLHVALLDKAKAELVAYDLSATNARIPPGGLRYFAYNLQDPPAGVQNLSIAFNTGAGHAEAGQDTAEAGHAAAAPVEAQPLSPESPDALPHHE